MATATGKAARKRHGTRFAAKRAKTGKRTHRRFGQLPYCEARKNSAQFIFSVGPALVEAAAAARIAKGKSPRDASVSVEIRKGEATA